MMKKNISFLIIATLLTVVFFPLTARSADEGSILTIKVEGMVCDFCARALEKTFLKQDAVEHITIDLSAKTLTVHLNPGQNIDDDTIQQLVKKAGYSLKEISRE